MSRERIMEILERFDLSPIESIVYIYLAKSDCKSIDELSSNLEMEKKRLYPVIKKLKNKKILICFSARVNLFSAISFEGLLDRIIDLDNKKSNLIIETKSEILDNWREITEGSQ